MRRVSDLMSEPVLVEQSTTVQAASARMLDAETEIAVVVDKGAVSGLLLARDIARALGEGMGVAHTRVDAICDPNPPLARPDEPLAEAHARVADRPHAVVIAVGPDRDPLGVLAF